MRVDAPEIIDSREESTMVSHWDIYLCAKQEGDIFKVCHMQHEVLGDASDYEVYDDRGELIEEMPDEIDGKAVFGVTDGLINGEYLVEDSEAYDSLVIELSDLQASAKVEEYLRSNGWHESLLATIMERFEAARGN